MFTSNTSNITYSYTGSVLIKDFLELGNDLINNFIQLNNGSELDKENLHDTLLPFINEKDETTVNMMKSIFSSAHAIILEELKDLQDKNSVNNGDVSSNVTVIIKNSANYYNSDILFLDSQIHDALVVGANYNWFKLVTNGSIVDACSKAYDEVITRIRIACRDMKQILERKVIPNPFLDSYL